MRRTYGYHGQSLGRSSRRSDKREAESPPLGISKRQRQEAERKRHEAERHRASKKPRPRPKSATTTKHPKRQKPSKEELGRRRQQQGFQSVDDKRWALEHQQRDELLRKHAREVAEKRKAAAVPQGMPALEDPRLGGRDRPIDVSGSPVQQVEVGPPPLERVQRPVVEQIVEPQMPAVRPGMREAPIDVSGDDPRQTIDLTAEDIPRGMPPLEGGGGEQKVKKQEPLRASFQSPVPQPQMQHADLPDPQMPAVQPGMRQDPFDLTQEELGARQNPIDVSGEDPKKQKVKFKADIPALEPGSRVPSPVMIRDVEPPHAPGMRKNPIDISKERVPKRRREGEGDHGGEVKRTMREADANPRYLELQRQHEAMVEQDRRIKQSQVEMSQVVDDIPDVQMPSRPVSAIDSELMKLANRLGEAEFPMSGGGGIGGDTNAFGMPPPPVPVGGEGGIEAVENPPNVPPGLPGLEPGVAQPVQQPTRPPVVHRNTPILDLEAVSNLQRPPNMPNLEPGGPTVDLTAQTQQPGVPAAPPRVPVGRSGTPILDLDALSNLQRPAGMPSLEQGGPTVDLTTNAPVDIKKFKPDVKPPIKAPTPPPPKQPTPPPPQMPAYIPPKQDPKVPKNPQIPKLDPKKPKLDPRKPKLDPEKPKFDPKPDKSKWRSATPFEVKPQSPKPKPPPIPVEEPKKFKPEERKPEPVWRVPTPVEERPIMPHLEPGPLPPGSPFEWPRKPQPGSPFEWPKKLRPLPRRPSRQRVKPPPLEPGSPMSDITEGPFRPITPKSDVSMYPVPSAINVPRKLAVAPPGSIKSIMKPPRDRDAAAGVGVGQTVGGTSTNVTLAGLGGGGRGGGGASASASSGGSGARDSAYMPALIAALSKKNETGKTATKKRQSGITAAKKRYTDKRKLKMSELRALKSKRIREHAAKTKKMPKAERDKARREFKKKVNDQFKEVSKRFPTARGLKDLQSVRALIDKIERVRLPS